MPKRASRPASSSRPLPRLSSLAQSPGASLRGSHGGRHMVRIAVRGLQLSDLAHVDDQPHQIAVTIDGRLLAYGEVRAHEFVDGGISFVAERPLPRAPQIPSVFV